MEDQEEIIEQLEKLDLTLSNIRRIFKQIENKIDIYKIKNDNLVANLQPWINFFGLNDDDVQSVVINKDFRCAQVIEQENQKDENLNISKIETTSKKNDEHENSDSSSLVTLNFDMLPETFKNEKKLTEIFYCIQKSKKISINDLFTFCKEEEKLKIFLNVLINKKMIKIENDYIVCKK